MLPVDVPVWFQYLDTLAPKYLKLFYNVAVTSLDTQLIPGIQSIVDMWMYSISKRIDVIAELTKEMHIIEVTKRAGLRCIGQMVSYKRLYDLVKPFPKPGIPIVVCEYADPDVAFVCDSLDVKIVELAPRPVQQMLKDVFSQLEE